MKIVWILLLKIILYLYHFKNLSDTLVVLSIMFVQMQLERDMLLQKNVLNPN